jgi:D-alanine-D-alanine ligase
MAQWTGKKIGLLYGGRSSEREVSLNTGKACGKALESKGYAVSYVDVGLEVAAELRAKQVDVAFIALHGRWGEDGCIQGLLESMGIPYTGSGVLASALGMDKVSSKNVFQAKGIKIADWRVFPHEKAGEVFPEHVPFGFPAVVKPAGEGSSVGVHIVRNAAALREACLDAAKYKGEVIVEKYIKGKEIAVGVLDGEALGAIEIVPANEFYDYAAKYTAGTTQYFYPARVSPAHARALDDAARRAHLAIGCAGATRVDFILAEDGTPYCLEVNTLPGMTATSLIPKIAAGKGIDFPALCERLLDGASLKA